ncbi:MAG: hypothetical protein KJ831_14075 [Candidatus Eisenbacteria bacterium]|nr:hypothetical protein [Candidatus Eisenbacteria bacterium]
MEAFTTGPKVNFGRVTGSDPGILVVSRDSAFLDSLRVRCSDIDPLRFQRVETGRSALDSVEAREVRLALVDETVVDMAADHLVYLLHTLKRDLPILFLTASPSLHQERAARRSGALLYAPKGDWDLIQKALSHYSSGGKKRVGG